MRECEYGVGQVVPVHGKGAGDRERREVEYVWELFSETERGADGKAGKVGSGEKGTAETEEKGERECGARGDQATCFDRAEQLCAADFPRSQEDTRGDQRDSGREGGGLRGDAGEQESEEDVFRGVYRERIRV